MHESLLGQEHQQVAESKHIYLKTPLCKPYIFGLHVDSRAKYMGCRGSLTVLRQARQVMVKGWQTVLQKVLQMKQTIQAVT